MSDFSADTTGIPTESSSGPPPDYTALVTYLLKPFVEVEEQLKVDSEFSSARARVWVRVAFDGADSTRLLGRGGRNIQALRRILEGVAEASGHTAYLDVYGNSPPQTEKKNTRPATSKPRPALPKPVKKSATPEAPDL